MAVTYRLYGSRSDYADVLRDLIANGKPIESRVGSTMELEDVTISVTHPAAITPIGRPAYNMTFGLLESAQLVGGFSDEGAMTTVLPKFGDFSDFHGAYGSRVDDLVGVMDINQVQNVIQILKKDPYSRRAVISLWDTGADAPGGHTDHPCTLAITFRVRRGKLNMSVHMRSNDIWRGWAYDCVQFAQLQITIAGFVGVGVGTYTHHADSFHIYDRDIATAEKYLADRPWVTVETPQTLVGFKGRHTNYGEMQVDLKKAARGTTLSYRASDDAKRLLWGIRKYVAKRVEEEDAS